MNPFQKLLQSIGASGIKRASGLIDDVVRSRLLVDSQRPIQRSAGVLSGDILERLRSINKFQQKAAPLFYPGDFKTGGFSPSTPSVFNSTGVYSNLNPTQRFLQEYPPIQRFIGTNVADNYVPIQKSVGANLAKTAASLKPTSVPTTFPFDDPLALLKGQARYVQRQVQGGIGRGMQNVAEALLPKQAFNPVGGVGGLIQNLNKATNPLLQSSNIVKNIPGLGSLPGFARNMLVPASPAGVAFAVAGLEGSSPQGFDNWSQLGYKSKEDMQNRVNTQITKEGIVDTGRYIPGAQQKTIFEKQVDSPRLPVISPVNPGFMQAGAPNIGAGTPDQRRAIEESNYRTQLSNAKQQYATPDPMSPDFQGYPNELAAQYGLEQAYGQELKQAGTLVPQLQEAGAGAGMTPENFAAWANANPGLAVRLLSQGQRN